MQSAMESMFGPWLGIAGFAMMVMMFAPKVIVWYRGYRLRRRGADAYVQASKLVPRELSYSEGGTAQAAHERFGEACVQLAVRRRYVALTSLLWMLPFMLNYVMPQTWDMRLVLFVVTIPFAFAGLWRIRHIFDKTIFYKTGFVHQIGFARREIDYNAVINFRKRQSSMTLTTSSYIFIVEDEPPVAFDCAEYVEGSRTVARVIKGLAPRALRSAAQENALKEKSAP